MKPQTRAVRGRRRPWVKAVLTHAVLIAFGCLFILPFYWLVSTSVKPDADIFKIPPVWIPSPIHWENYPKAVEYIPFLRYTFNTLRICTVNVAGIVLSCSLVAYSLAKIKWKGRDVVFYSLIATMLLPSQVTMLPSFMIFKWLGWIGTILPLTVPAFCGTAFSIFLLRQFFMTIPNELSDAARIDGCNELQIYWKIVMPLAKPALATISLFAFVGSWNDFIGPLLYLNDDRTYTLSLGLQSFMSQHGAEWGMLMAASTLMALPIVVLFFLAQKTFIRGIATTGSKE